VIINKQGTFRPFANPLCVYPPPFLAIHHWGQPQNCPFPRGIQAPCQVSLRTAGTLCSFIRSKQLEALGINLFPNAKWVRSLEIDSLERSQAANASAKWATFGKHKWCCEMNQTTPHGFTGSSKSIPQTATQSVQPFHHSSRLCPTHTDKQTHFTFIHLRHLLARMLTVVDICDTKLPCVRSSQRLEASSMSWHPDERPVNQAERGQCFQAGLRQ